VQRDFALELDPELVVAEDQDVTWSRAVEFKFPDKVSRRREGTITTKGGL